MKFWLNNTKKCDECGKVIDVDSEENYIEFNCQEGSTLIHIDCIEKIWERVKNDYKPV